MLVIYIIHTIIIVTEKTGPVLNGDIRKISGLLKVPMVKSGFSLMGTLSMSKYFALFSLYPFV